MEEVSNHLASHTFAILSHPFTLLSVGKQQLISILTRSISKLTTAVVKKNSSKLHLFIRQTQTSGYIKVDAREVVDLTLDLGEGCFPRFVELTPSSRRILLAASRRVALPLDPLLTLMVNPLISTRLTRCLLPFY